MIPRVFRAAMILLAAAVAGAQRPNYSGEWVRVADSSASSRPSVAAAGDVSFRRGDMGTGWGASVTITQRADSLVVEYPYFIAYDLQPPIRLAYALDGSESRNVLMVGHADEVQRSRLAWQGSALVITTLHPVPATTGGRPVTAEVRQVLNLLPDGSLSVETTRAGVLGGPVTAVRGSYSRK